MGAKRKTQLEVKHWKRTRKVESIRIRIAAADKRLLERAATIAALTVSGFILSAAVERARSMIAGTPPSS
jgi:uncharacterized protein (DUF1778 family)